MATKSASTRKRSGSTRRNSANTSQNRPRSARLRQGGSKSGGSRMSSSKGKRSGTPTSRSRSKSSTTRSRSSGNTQSGSKAKMTKDHDEIRRWAEQHGGSPASVKGTSKGGEAGLLRIDFPGFSGERTLQKISWEEFFDKFDEQNLTFLYDSKKDSRFNKFVCGPAGKSGSRSRSSNSRTRSR
jgi:hypothetical protein